MQLKRTLAFGAIGGAFAAWIASAAMTGVRPVPEVRVAAPTPVERQGAALDAEIARLRERLRPTTPPQQPARNLFSFATAPAAREGTAITAPPPVPVAAAAPEPPVRTAPMFTLVGLAEDHGAGGVVRTAIIAVHGEVHLVKEGEPVVDGYRAATIGADSVVLADPAGTITLRLK